MRKRYVTLQCFMLLLVCFSISTTSYTDVTSSNSKFFEGAVQIVVHDAIIIRNNTDFLEQKVANGWPGNGSVEDPILISNYRIEFEQEGIVIENVDLSFVIQNCETGDYEYDYWNSVGIRIKNCTHGVILDSTAHMKKTGVRIEKSDNITLYNTIIHDCYTGVSILNSSNIILAENNLSWNDFEGINVTLSERCQIFDNSIVAVPDYGIVCLNDKFTTLENNDISSTYLDDEQFSHVGILSAMSWNLWIYEAYIIDCWIGINTLMTTDYYVIACEIANSIDTGIFLGSGTSNVTLVNNYLGSTSGSNAYDEGIGNVWDNPYSQEGNWWSDYSGSGYYYIAGPAGSIDHHPSAFQPGTSTAFPTTSHPTLTTPPPNGSGPPIVLPFREIMIVGIAIELVVILYLLERRNQRTFG